MLTLPPGRTARVSHSGCTCDRARALLLAVRSDVDRVYGRQVLPNESCLLLQLKATAVV